MFGLLFKQVDYIAMFFAITGAIFLGGAGCAILGGLYWKKGTTSAAWAGMITGSILGVGGIVIQQIWKVLDPSLVYLLEYLEGVGIGTRAIRLAQNYLTTYADKFPINGQVLFFYGMISSIVVYVTVSLLTCKEGFNMDRMLHRGKYAIEGASPESSKRKWTWGSIMGFDREFTLGDKIISGSMFCWSLFWFAIFAVMTLWYLVRPWPLSVWISYWHISAIWIPLFIGIVTTIWFTWGGTRDLIRLFRVLPTVKRDARDDGIVVGHRNLDETAGSGNGVLEREP